MSDFFNQMDMILREAMGTGKQGQELTDEILRLKEKYNLGEPELRDLFQVSEEEEALWYDDSAEIDSFEVLKESIRVNNGLFPEVYMHRKAMRDFSDELKVYLLNWIRRENTKKVTDLSSFNINMFRACTYFAAEYHLEEFYPEFIHWMAGFKERPFDIFFDYLYTVLPCVLYAVFDGNLDLTLKSMCDPSIHVDFRNIMADMMTQFSLDGVFEKERMMGILKTYVKATLENEDEGTRAAEWIARMGLSKRLEKVLRRLLESVDPMYYGTCNPKEFSKMEKESREVKARKDLTMDDSILNGMYRKAVHPPEGLREKVEKEQMERIARFTRMFH